MRTFHETVDDCGRLIRSCKNSYGTLRSVENPEGSVWTGKTPCRGGMVPYLSPTSLLLFGPTRFQVVFSLIPYLVPTPVSRSPVLSSKIRTEKDIDHSSNPPLNRFVVIGVDCSIRTHEGGVLTTLRLSLTIHTFTWLQVSRVVWGCLPRHHCPFVVIVFRLSGGIPRNRNRG